MLDLLQITLVVRDLEAVAQDLENAFGLRVAFRDPGVKLWGLENAVLPMGTTFIELIAPVEPNTPGGRQLDRMGGDGGYMVILQTDTVEGWRSHLEKIGVRIAWEGKTEDPEHDLRWSGFHLHPADTGGMMISLDQPDPADSWVGAGAHWRDFIVQDVVDALESIEIRSKDPTRLSARWAEILDRACDRDGAIPLDKGRVDFCGAASGELEGLNAIALHAVDRSRAGRSHSIGGVEFRLV